MNKKITRRNPRQYILNRINNLSGFRLLNVKNKVGTRMDKDLLNEALGFRSLCLFSKLDDKELLRLWDNSNLEFML